MCSILLFSSVCFSTNVKQGEERYRWDMRGQGREGEMGVEGWKWYKKCWVQWVLTLRKKGRYSASDDDIHNLITLWNSVRMTIDCQFVLLNQTTSLALQRSLHFSFILWSLSAADRTLVAIVAYFEIWHYQYGKHKQQIGPLTWKKNVLQYDQVHGNMVNFILHNSSVF